MENLGLKQAEENNMLMGRKKRRETTGQFLGRKTTKFFKNVGKNTGKELENPRNYVTAAEIAATLL
jgi:hypothetical protein